jgi:hypothetical protein
VCKTNHYQYFFESASALVSTSIRKRSVKHGLRTTDAATRFEKGVDIS